MKCLIASFQGGEVVLLTQEGEFRTVSAGLLLDQLSPESRVGLPPLQLPGPDGGDGHIPPTWTGRELELPWPLPGTQNQWTEATPPQDSPRKSRTSLTSLTFRRPVWAGRLGALAAAAALLLVLLPKGLDAYATQSVVAIDINPSLELKVDGRGAVVVASPLNDDARKVLDTLDLRQRTLSEAIDLVLDRALGLGYLASQRENVVLVAVVPVRGSGTLDAAALQGQIAARLRTEGLQGYVAVEQVEAAVRRDGQREGLSVNQELVRRLLEQRGLPYSPQALSNQSIGQTFREAGLSIEAVREGGERIDGEGQSVLPRGDGAQKPPDSEPTGTGNEPRTEAERETPEDQGDAAAEPDEPAEPVEDSEATAGEDATAEAELQGMESETGPSLDDADKVPEADREIEAPEAEGD